ncbi:MAG TPA: thioesterase family protein [Alphaproteobacteria bacterium]|nr:thioesterase family protein [Alphaproteobacteria bacterium]
MPAFIDHVRIRFAHVDPAGIVFYARYFEIINSVLEDWFRDGLEHDFGLLNEKDRVGIPLLHIEADFIRPSFLNDIVEFRLSVEKIGNSSFTLNYEGRLGDEVRLKMKAVHAFVELDQKKSVPIPDAVRERMTEFLVPPA